MLINHDKSKCMLFKRARKHDFEPELKIFPGNQQEQVKEMKLVGDKLRSDLKTVWNTQYIASKKSLGKNVGGSQAQITRS